MDNAMARCRDNQEAYLLSFSKRASDAQKMVHMFCMDCPVRLTCLAEATLNDYYGVWGGQTRAERQESRNLLLNL